MQGSRIYLAGFILASVSLCPAAWAQETPNASSVLQEGSGNAASIVQTGSGNAASIRQFGRDNTGIVVQSGTGNSACLVQAGRSLTGTIQQTGDNQSIGLLQTRWGSNEIPVEACATAGTRQDVMGYAIRRPDTSARGRAFGRVRGQP